MTAHQTAHPVPLGERLRATRHALGLSQEALAFKAGISVATIRRVEHSQVHPTGGTQRLLQIALAETHRNDL